MSGSWTKSCTGCMGCRRRRSRGILTLDANSIFYVVEGAIGYAQALYPDLTNAGRLPHILEELDTYLETIKSCCSLDGTLHISDQVFDEVSLDDRREIVRKGLIQLKKYNEAERRQMLQVLRDHFPRPSVVPEREIQELCDLYPNLDIRPHDRDASLIVVACHLAARGQNTVVLTSDPDFIEPIKRLMHQGPVILGGETFPTNKIIYRDYFRFLLRLHDGCSLPTARYEPLATAYYAALVTRLPKLEKQEVINRDRKTLMEVWKIHSESIRLKAARAQERG